MKILLVEDEKALVEVLRLEFEDAHFEARMVLDGAEAMDAAKEFHPDIILLDLLLPNKDGFEILAELKKDATLKDVPVIILSNLGQEEDMQRATKLGAVDYYIKAQHPIKEVIAKAKQYASQAKKGSRT